MEEIFGLSELTIRTFPQFPPTSLAETLDSQAYTRRGTSSGAWQFMGPHDAQALFTIAFECATPAGWTRDGTLYAGHRPAD